MMMLDNIFYMYSNMDSGSQILLFLIVLVALMLVSIFIINIITKKKDEKYDKLFNPIDKYTKFVEKTSVNKPEKISNKEIVNKKVETPVSEITEIEVKKEQPNNEEEIEVLNDSEIIEIVSDDNSSIDKISMLIEDNINNPKPIDLTKFEQEEEKNAIISYDELVRRAGAKKIVYKTESKQEIKEQKKPQTNNEPKGKFKASQVISPIYGIKKNDSVKKDELEEFIELDDIAVDKNKSINDQELQNDITFLTNLKTFRSNLD